MSMSKKPNRNASCGCGSGKKYKQCCGQVTPSITEDAIRAMTCNHLFKRAAEPVSTESLVWPIQKLSLETCLKLKEIHEISFRECWEGAPSGRRVPSHLRGMASMGSGLYCREHRVVVIPLEHDLVPGAETVVAIADVDLPSCSEEEAGLN